MKTTALKIGKTPIFSHRLEVLEIFYFTFHFPVLFLCTKPYYHQSLSHLIGACFSKEIKLYALQWDLEFSRNCGKKWVPTYTTVVAYLTTIDQPFPIFRKLLTIIPSMKNYPHLIILNQKLTNSTSAVIPNQLWH